MIATPPNLVRKEVLNCMLYDSMHNIDIYRAFPYVYGGGNDVALLILFLKHEPGRHQLVVRLYAILFSGTPPVALNCWLHNGGECTHHLFNLIITILY